MPSWEAESLDYDAHDLVPFYVFERMYGQYVTLLKHPGSTDQVRAIWGSSEAQTRSRRIHAAEYGRMPGLVPAVPDQN